MQTAFLIAHQVVLMLMLLATGALCARLGWFTETVAYALSKFLLGVVTPALLLKAFYQSYDSKMAQGLLLSAGLSLLYHLIAIGAARVMVRTWPDARSRVARMGMIYSNCGFMAFPLLYATMGDNGIFYGSAFVGVFNIVLWTHGRALLVGRQGVNLKKAILNPGVMGTLCGVLLYLSGLHLPSVAVDLMSSLASLNTPLAMLLTGVFLSQCAPRELMNGRVFFPTAARMILIPGLFLLALVALPVTMWSQDAHRIAMAVLLCSSCPAAASTVLMTSSLRMDSGYGAQIIFASCALSILTIPLLSLLGELLF